MADFHLFRNFYLSLLSLYYQFHLLLSINFRYSDRVTQLEQEIRNIKYFSAQERTFTGLETVEVELADDKIL